MKKLYRKYMACKSEIKDLESEFNSQNQHLTDALRETLKSNNLYKIILDNFVPPEHMRQLKRRCVVVVVVVVVVAVGGGGVCVELLAELRSLVVLYWVVLCWVVLCPFCVVSCL